MNLNDMQKKDSGQVQPRIMVSTHEGIRSSWFQEKLKEAEVADLNAEYSADHKMITAAMWALQKIERERRERFMPTLNERVEALVQEYFDDDCPDDTPYPISDVSCSRNPKDRDGLDSIDFYTPNEQGLPALVNWSVERQEWYDATKQDSCGATPARGDGRPCKPNGGQATVAGTDAALPPAPEDRKESGAHREILPPQDKSSDAGEGYRILRVGEVIQAGDTSRYKGDGAGWRWADACVCVGMKVEEDDGNFYRRKISVQHAPHPPKGLPEIPETHEYYEGEFPCEGARSLWWDTRTGAPATDNSRTQDGGHWFPAKDGGWNKKYWAPFRNGHEILYAIRPKQSTPEKREGATPALDSASARRTFISPARGDSGSNIPHQPPAESRLDGETLGERFRGEVQMQCIFELVDTPLMTRWTDQDGRKLLTFCLPVDMPTNTDDAQTETDRLVTLARKFREAVDSMKV